MCRCYSKRKPQFDRNSIINDIITGSSQPVVQKLPKVYIYDSRFPKTLDIDYCESMNIQIIELLNIPYSFTFMEKKDPFLHLLLMGYQILEIQSTNWESLNIS